MAQLIHEAACHNISDIVLAVLFGGQNFEVFRFTIEEGQKEQLIRDMAKFWAHVETKQPIEPETTEQAKLIYATSTPTAVTATQTIEMMCQALAYTKEQLKLREEEEEKLKLEIQKFMGNNSELVTLDGRVLATWKSAKPSMSFDKKLFEQSMPDVYKSYVREVAGSRRFLVKG
jgi:hypothetical protein